MSGRHSISSGLHSTPRNLESNMLAVSRNGNGEKTAVIKAIALSPSSAAGFAAAVPVPSRYRCRSASPSCLTSDLDSGADLYSASAGVLLESYPSRFARLGPLQLLDLISQGNWDKIGFMATREEERVHPDCVNASNPYHQCTEICFKKIADAKDPNKRRDRSVQNGERSKEQQGIMASGVRNVDPLCVNASNPYHICTEYCFYKRTTKSARKQTRGGRSVDNKEGFDMGQNRKVDLKCVNASNPYHVCSDYCFQKMHEKDRLERGKPVVVRGQKIDGLNMLDIRDVHPKCVNASNPYHKCAEYCFQRINETT